MTKIFILLFLFALTAVAKNSNIVSHENQLKMKIHCNEVTTEDIQKAGYACRPLGLAEKFRTNPSEIFEKLAFEEAAKFQVLKNKCIIEKLDTIKKKGKWHHTWNEIVFSNWLAAKQADAVFNYCRIRNKDPLARANEKISPSLAFDKSMLREIKADPRNENQIRKRAEKWRSACADVDFINDLADARKLSLDLIPAVSSAQAFKILDKKQNLMTNRKTTLPLSDSDFLDNDLSDLSFIDIDRTKPLWDELNQMIVETAERKAQMNQRIADAFDRGELDEDVKDEIYEDNTVLEMLSQKEYSQKQEPNKAAACLVARYEPNIKAEIIDLGVSSFATGTFIGGLAKLARLRQAAKYAKALDYIQNNQTYIGSAAVSGNRLLGKCLSPAAAARKSRKINPSELASHSKAADLSKRHNEMKFVRLNIRFTPEETPSCFEAGLKNQMIEESNQQECLFNEFSNALSLRLGVGVMVIKSAFD